MTFSRPGRINRYQRGFTLIEVVIAIAIMGFMGGGVTTIIFQVLNMNARSVAHMTAIKEVENAVHWITRDAQMAQNVNATGPSGFPLTLTWVDWNSNPNIATYGLVNGQLQRRYSVNGGQTVNTVVAHIDSAQTSCSVTSTTVAFKITSTIGGSGPASETRSFNVTPRCAPIIINVTSSLTVANSSLPNGQAGVAYSQTLAATGGFTPYIWSIASGPLPSGLSLNSSTGAITGTPTTAGTSSFTVQVTDNAWPNAQTANQGLSIYINAALTITTTALPNGQAGVAYSQTLVATGGITPYTWSIASGSLPSGLSLNSSTGAISGTPTTTGTSNFTVQVTDSASPTQGTATKALSITINSINVTLYPTKDTYVLSQSASTNYENYGWVRVGYYSGSGADNYRTLAQFDLTSLAGKTIDSAYLKLYCQAEDYGSTITTNVYRITGTWNVATVTWNTQPAYNSTTLAANSVGGTGWKTWDVTASVQAFASGTYTNNGWLLRSPSSTVRDTFTDNSAGGTSTGPQLVVTYH